MQGLRKEDWRYAFLMVLLFAIAALAAQALLNYTLPLIDHDERIVFTALLCTLSFGMMLISGAFGLWAIKFEATTISTHKLGDLVSAMSYIKDGVISLNNKGSITGMNPAAKKLFNIIDKKPSKLSDLCPQLSKKNIELLYKSSNQEEVETSIEHSGRIIKLRFRSQPSKDTTLILINDVTKLSDIRTRRRHAAYLQLIGHIAQGVANDFNNLLCCVSGHASLILRTNDSTSNESAKAIVESANKGIQIAGRLLELSSASQSAQSATIEPAIHVNIAVDGLASDIHSSWEIIRNISSDSEPTCITGAQLEHIIHGLGMLATDIYNKTRVITIQLSKPAETGLTHVIGDFAGVIIITPTKIDSFDHSSLHARDAGSVGTIESVVSSILTQSGGSLDCFSSHSGIPLYRICLPHATNDQIRSQQQSLSIGLEAYIANWNILLCKDKNPHKEIKNYMESCKVNVEYADSIIDTLSRIEDGNDLNAIIINAATLGHDPKGLLRAIIKLCPNAGLVIIDKPDSNNQPLSSEVVYVPQTFNPAQIAQAMIESRTLARSR